MNTMSSPSESQGTWVHTVLGDQNFRSDTGFLAWWYRHTAPPDPLPGATLNERDVALRGRIASAIMLFLGVVLIAVGLLGIFGPNHTLLFVAITILTAIALCIPLNKHGYVNFVGVLISLGVAGGMYSSILTAPGGVSPNDKDILFLLFFSELFIGVILPIRWMYVVAGLNILFSIFVLRFWHHTPALDALLPTSYFAILVRICQIHVFVTGVLGIVVSIMKATIKRANRAEELAKLQHDIAQMQKAQMQQKKALDESIRTINFIHQQVANGRLDARVPLQEGMVLWEMAGTLNNLLNRYQRLDYAEKELREIRPYIQYCRQLEHAFKQMQADQAVLVQALNKALQEHRPLRFPLINATPFDPLFRALNGKYISLSAPINREGGEPYVR